MQLRRLFTCLSLLLTLLAALPLHAQQRGNKTLFGKGNPFTLEELPAGELKTKLLALPPQTRATAMQWLHTIDFHAIDAAKHLRVDDGGGIYILCPKGGCEGCADHDHHHEPEDVPSPAPEKIDPAADSSGEPVVPAAAPVPIISPPAYNSRPGSTRHLYLDFNGGNRLGKTMEHQLRSHELGLQTLRQRWGPYHVQRCRAGRNPPHLGAHRGGLFILRH